MARKGVTLNKYKSLEELEHEITAAHQPQANFWSKTFELLDSWFLIRGLDPQQQRLDRTKFTRKVHPWLVPHVDAKGQDFDS